MTTPSQITYCAARARTADLVGAAAASRPPVHRIPRSTFRPTAWVGRCVAPLFGTPAAPNPS
jgi:hypothetical protein